MTLRFSQHIFHSDQFGYGKHAPLGKTESESDQWMENQSDPDQIVSFYKPTDPEPGLFFMRAYRLYSDPILFEVNRSLLIIFEPTESVVPIRSKNNFRCADYLPQN
jgi:hypothetical protein